MNEVIERFSRYISSVLDVGADLVPTRPAEIERREFIVLSDVFQ